jgi:hypothetical protein
MSFPSFFPKTRRETWTERKERGETEAEALAEAMAAERLVFESQPDAVKTGLRFVRLCMAVCLPIALAVSAWSVAAAAALSLAFGVPFYVHLKLKKNKPASIAAAPLVAAAVGAALGAAVVQPFVKEVLHGVR